MRIVNLRRKRPKNVSSNKKKLRIEFTVKESLPKK